MCYLEKNEGPNISPGYHEMEGLCYTFIYTLTDYYSIKKQVALVEFWGGLKYSKKHPESAKKTLEKVPEKNCLAPEIFHKN